MLTLLRGRKRAWECPELELWMLWAAMWVLEIKLRSSGRAVVLTANVSLQPRPINSLKLLCSLLFQSCHFFLWCQNVYAVKILKHSSLFFFFFLFFFRRSANPIRLASIVSEIGCPWSISFPSRMSMPDSKIPVLPFQSLISSLLWLMPQELSLGLRYETISWAFR